MTRPGLLRARNTPQQPIPMPRLLRDWLRERYPQASVSTLRRMVQDGRVRIADVPARRFDQLVEDNQPVRVLDRAAASTAAPPASSTLQPLRLIHEDADVLVVEKPAGLLTSSGVHDRRTTAVEIVSRYLAGDSAARPGLIHRLDKDASGLLVFSKNEAAFKELKRQFFEHTVLRVYLAITRRPPNPARGRIATNLLERADGTVHCVDPRRAAPGADRGEPAITDYATVRGGADGAAVVVTLHTGRKHQIRVHLLSRAGGIMNDRLYGASEKNPPGRLMLAALVLGFAQPSTRQWMQFERPAPRDFPLVAGARMAALADEAGMELKRPALGKTEPDGSAVGEDVGDRDVER
jgi:23S rRNA pseudouridine1911/1915/1917 synthase